MADGAIYDEEKPSTGDSVTGQYKQWYNRVEKARKCREDWERDYDVKKCEEFFLGKQWKQKNGPRVLNHFLATIKVTQTNLLFENPKALVRPKPGREVTSARKATLAEEVLSAIMSQDDNFSEASGLALLQAFFRIGVLKSIYDPKMEPNPNAQREVTQKDSDGNPMLDEMGEPQPMLDPMTGQPIIEPDFVVSDDTYRWEWVDAKCMLLPDAGPYMRKWPWIGEEVTVPLDEAKADERFPAELRMQFKSNVKEDKRYGKNSSKTRAPESDEDEYCQLFRYCELYDIRKKRWLCLAEDQDFDEALIDDALPEGVEDHPYAILPGWTPILGPEPSPWPLPHVYPWLDVQEEYNIRRTQQMEAAKRSARKIFYTESSFDDKEEALKMLQSSKDMEGVKINSMTELPQVVADPPLNAQVNADVGLLLNDYRIISGQTGAKLSGSSDANTATEAQFIERASTLRDAELQKAVYKWLKTALRKMLQLVKATLTNGMFVKLRGMNEQEMGQMLMSVAGIPPEMLQVMPGLQQYLIRELGTEKMEHVSREDLTFEADIDIVPGSTRPRSLPQEKTQLLEFLSLFAQYPQIAMVPSLMQEIASKYEFLSPLVVQECIQMATMMVQLNANQAGRSQGGQNTAKENTEGQGNDETSQRQAQAARGIG